MLLNDFLITCRSAEKGQKLQEALQYQLFLRAVDDIESWMDDAEIHLNSEDLGKDLTSVANLLKKHSVRLSVLRDNLIH